jgi:hypothetical protein
VDRDLALVVRRSAAEQEATLLARLERRCRPAVEGVDRLDVVVSVEEDGWLAGRVQPIRVDDRVPGGLDNFGMLEPDRGILRGQMFRGPPNVIDMVGLTRDARDAQELLELAQAALARVFEKLLGRAQASR